MGRRSESLASCSRYLTSIDILEMRSTHRTLLAQCPQVYAPAHRNGLNRYRHGVRRVAWSGCATECVCVQWSACIYQAYFIYLFILTIYFIAKPGYPQTKAMTHKTRAPSRSEETVEAATVDADTHRSPILTRLECAPVKSCDLTPLPQHCHHQRTFPSSLFCGLLPCMPCNLCYSTVFVF